MNTEKVSFKATPANSLFLTKRRYPENEEPFAKRAEFQRDRDRIIHSHAFRRLMHKTQIYNANEGDHYRNRLTHTLEVMQIGRSIGRLLGLDEDLIEAIALGHDLGHTPFGHVGERTLCNILYNGIDSKSGIKEHFKHNFQSLRVVDGYENRCADYDGMNLTLAVREGMLKHTKLTCKVKSGDKNVVQDVKYGDDFYSEGLRIKLEHSYTLEGQVVAIADEIAQITHDIEDGLRGGVIKINNFLECSLVQEYLSISKESISNKSTNTEVNQMIKRMIGFLINDVYVTSRNKIVDYIEKIGEPGFTNEYDVYNDLCISFSEKLKPMTDELDDNKTKWIIHSKEISQEDYKAEYMIKQMYKAYYKHPMELPDYVLERYYDKEENCLDRNMINEKELKADPKFKRLICDHIAGMTDQYAAREYNNLYVPRFY